MDFNFINEHIPLYVEAAKLTLIMAFWGILLAIVVGLIVSLIRYFKVPVLDKIVGFYIELSRNTPLLIQLFFLYFGLPKVGIVLTSEQCGVIGLAFLGGSYMAEAFRSGLDNVESIQIQSALSLGMKKSQTFRYVILPQFISACLIHGQCPQLIKYTQIITQNLPKCYNYSCWADSSILVTSSSDAFCLFSFFSATLLSANLISIPHI